MQSISKKYWCIACCLLWESYGTLFARSIPLSFQGDTRSWIMENFAKGKVPPFSFVYGGKPSATFITKWSYSYILKNEDTYVTMMKKGKELMKGFELLLDQAPGSLLIRYSKIK